MWALFLMLSVLPANCLAAGDSAVGVVNHVMAEKIEYVQGKGFFVNGPAHIRFVMPPGAASTVSKFATLDQLMFMSGTYKVDLKVVDEATGAVLGEASHNSLTVKDDRTIQSFVTDWSLNSKPGLYTYQVIANSAVIASFKIDIANAP